jgi:hypothetical protein
MRGVSKRVSKLLAVSAFALLAAVHPAQAASKRTSANGDSPSHSILRTIIRHILDLTDIRFPPG